MYVVFFGGPGESASHTSSIVLFDRWIFWKQNNEIQRHVNPEFLRHVDFLIFSLRKTSDTKPNVSVYPLRICNWLTVLTVLKAWQTRPQTVSLFARARNICCGHKDTKMFLFCFANIWCPQQMFLGLVRQENIMSNNVSPIRCPRLPPPL